MGLGGIGAAPGRAQLSGRVYDAGGRGLPFVTVVSRTRNGYAAVWTDVTGRFAFPGRPHRAGDRLRITSAGFRPLVMPVGGGETALDVVLGERAPVPAGWSIGLPESLVVRVEPRAGGPLGDGMGVGGTVQVSVMSPLGPACRRAGPAAWVPTDRGVRLAVGEFVRAGTCREVETPVWVVGLRFRRSGVRTITVVGRHADTDVEIRIVPPGGSP